MITAGNKGQHQNRVDVQQQAKTTMNRATTFTDASKLATNRGQENLGKEFNGKQEKGKTVEISI